MYTGWSTWWITCILDFRWIPVCLWIFSMHTYAMNCDFTIWEWKKKNVDGKFLVKLEGMNGFFSLRLLIYGICQKDMYAFKNRWFWHTTIYRMLFLMAAHYRFHVFDSNISQKCSVALSRSWIFQLEIHFFWLKRKRIRNRIVKYLWKKFTIKMLLRNLRS